MNDFQDLETLCNAAVSTQDHITLQSCTSRCARAVRDTGADAAEGRFTFHAHAWCCLIRQLLQRPAGCHDGALSCCMGCHLVACQLHARGASLVQSLKLRQVHSASSLVNPACIYSAQHLGYLQSQMHFSVSGFKLPTCFIDIRLTSRFAVAMDLAAESWQSPASIFGWGSGVACRSCVSHWRRVSAQC